CPRSAPAATGRFVPFVELELQEVEEPAGLLDQRVRFQQELFFQRREVQREGQVVHERLVIHRLLQEVRERDAVLTLQEEVADQLHQLPPHVARELLLRRGEIRNQDLTLPVGLAAR